MLEQALARDSILMASLLTERRELKMRYICRCILLSPPLPPSSLSTGAYHGEDEEETQRPSSCGSSSGSDSRSEVDGYLRMAHMRLLQQDFVTLMGATERLNSKILTQADAIHDARNRLKVMPILTLLFKQIQASKPMSK